MSAVCAADVQISASLDKPQIATNEVAVLSITVSGDVSNLPDPQLPDLPNFQVSNAGRATNFSWINGKTSSSVKYSFVLAPKQVGHFQIPPVRVQVQGQTLQSEALTLDVVKGNAAALPPPPAAPAEQRSQTSRRIPGLFIRQTVDKETAYVGEPITLSFRLYNRLPMLRSPQYQPPDTSGFWTEDLPPQRTYNTTVDGVAYQVTEIRTALFPTTPGKAVVGPATLTVTMENLSIDPFSADFFNNFFGGGEQKTLRTDPIALQVKGLPEPKPAAFRGAVGQYRISSNLDKTSTTVGQPITLTVTVAGRGNIKSLPDLSMPDIPNFRSFAPTAATNIDKKDYQVEGSKVFKTVLIPTTSGDLDIPEISYVVFDPAARSYRTLKSESLTVRVAPAPAGSNLPAMVYGPMGTPPGVKVLGEDVRYIKTPVSLRSQGSPLYQRKWVWCIDVLAFLFLIGAGGVPLYRRLFLSNPALLRFRHANEVASRLMHRAENALERSDIKGAAEHLNDAFHGYLADKLRLEVQGVALKTVQSQMQKSGLSDHLTERVRGVWESLDLYRFAPAQVRPEELRQTRQSMEHLINQLEKEIVWKD